MLICKPELLNMLVKCIMNRSNYNKKPPAGKGVSRISDLELQRLVCILLFNLYFPKAVLKMANISK